MSVLVGNLPSACDVELAHNSHQYVLHSGDSELSNDPFFPMESQPAHDYSLPVSIKKNNTKQNKKMTMESAVALALALCVNTCSRSYRTLGSGKKREE